MAAKPIRVFYSELSRRFYATAHYKESSGVVTITGAKYDVTNDIARAITMHDLEFTPVGQEGGPDGATNTEAGQ
jgi:hypothetical protein